MHSLSEKIFVHKTSFTPQSSLERGAVETFFFDSLNLIFPGMVRSRFKKVEELDSLLSMHLLDLEKLLGVVGVSQKEASAIVLNYGNSLIPMSLEIEKDAKALLAGDPAAKDLIEVLLCYPGLYAIASYRLAHFLYLQKIPTIPRMICEIAHEKTGIDIHPGATIGDSFFIDHGTGVVIGETAVIGKNVKIYQGVTLGALSVEKNLALTKRHPTIEDNCVIYSNATILGGSTTIGEHSVIGGNVWLTKSVPARSMVYHKSEIKLDSLSSKQTGIDNE